MKKMLLVGLMLSGFTFADDTTTVSIDMSDCHCRLIVVLDSLYIRGVWFHPNGQCMTLRDLTKWTVVVGAASVLAVGSVNAETTPAVGAGKNDSATVKTVKQSLTKAIPTTQTLPKPTTNWSKLKDLFL